MTIRADLQRELQAAIKSGDRARRDVIRQVETEVATARSAPGFAGEVDDALYLAVIERYVKKMGKARDEYRGLGERGAAQAEKLSFEIEYLSRWLPAKAGADETRAIVRRVIAESGVTDPQQAGRVIGQVMRSGAELDGSLVNRIVREELGA